MELFRLKEDVWQSDLFPNGALDKYKFEEAFQILRTYSLVQCRDDQDTYYIHKLVHAWAHERLEDEEKELFSISSLKLLDTITALSRFGPLDKLRFIPHIMASYNSSVKICKDESYETKRNVGFVQESWWLP
jgi:hypothetical protein